LPAGWRAVFPQALLLGVLAVGLLGLAEAVRGGWAALDQLFWVEAAVLFPFVVVGFTATMARRHCRGDGDGDS
jgi:hypothetical protein